jgi:hypothetical protein
LWHSSPVGNCIAALCSLSFLQKITDRPGHGSSELLTSLCKLPRICNLLKHFLCKLLHPPLHRCACSRLQVHQSVVLQRQSETKLSYNMCGTHRHHCIASNIDKGSSVQTTSHRCCSCHLPDISCGAQHDITHRATSGEWNHTRETHSHTLPWPCRVSPLQREPRHSASSASARLV